MSEQRLWEWDEYGGIGQEGAPMPLAYTRSKDDAIMIVKHFNTELAALRKEIAQLEAERDGLQRKCNVLQDDAEFWMKKAKQLNTVALSEPEEKDGV